MNDESDYLEYAAHTQIRSPDRVNALLQEWNQSKRLLPVPVDQENYFHALVLELTPTGLVTVGRPAFESGRLAGYLYIVNNLFRIASPIKESFDRLREEVRQKLGLGLQELPERRGPLQFHDAISEALIFPIGPQAAENAAERDPRACRAVLRGDVDSPPRESLSNVAPVDAAGSPKLRKRLLGVIEFMQQCASGGMLAEYDFDRLRRKLGLPDRRRAAAGRRRVRPPADIPGALRRRAGGAGPGDAVRRATGAGVPDGAPARRDGSWRPTSPALFSAARCSRARRTAIRFSRSSSRRR